MYRSMTQKILLVILCTFFISGCEKAAQFHYGNGVAGTVDDFKGRITLINYWAEWCKPCLKEIPDLSELYHTKKGQVQVIGINWDGIKGEELNQVSKKFGLDFPVIIEDISPLFGLKKPEVLPTTYVLNAEGKIVDTLVGPQTLESLLKALPKAP